MDYFEPISRWLPRITVLATLVVAHGVRADDHAVLYDFSDPPSVFAMDGKDFTATTTDLEGQPGWHVTGRGGDAHFLYNTPIDLGARLREAGTLEAEVFIASTNLARTLNLTLENGWDPNGENADFVLDFAGLPRGQRHTLTFDVPDDMPALDQFTTYKIKHYGELPADVVLLELRLPRAEAQPAPEPESSAPTRELTPSLHIHTD